ncbi:MAG: UDP-N-acetylmuramate dehydrogenase [Terriglobales bacterium]|jgi:UDP-N-acetylmuramate dehydrogenase
MTIHENVPLAPMTTLHVGGPAQFFAEARHEEDVREAVDFSKTRNLPLFVLGGGSNLLVADSGWPGLVLRISIGGLTSESSGNNVLFSVGAGSDWDTFVAQAVTQNCAGVECLSGIPGSVGGTPVQNVGAYGQEVSETIESVRAFDTKENRTVVLPRPACGFRYRASIFNTGQRCRYIILRVNYRLHRGAAPTLKYADLQKHFAESKTPPSLASVREAVREIRRAKGMLLVPGDPNSRSAGSFFKNPVLTADQFQNLTARAAEKALEIPSYPALEAHHKISAAWLVEHSGFSKGFHLGEAAISTKHALALVNTGSAHASDIVHLKETIQQQVQTEWGVLLDPEPVFVGF